MPIKWRLSNKRIENEKTTNKKFQRELDIKIKELKRLREDTETLDSLNKKLEQLKKNYNTI
jgi:hypothetical protein